MVILYNRKSVNSFSKNFKRFTHKKNKVERNVSSHKLNVQRLTPSNRRFLISLGFKLKKWNI